MSAADLMEANTDGVFEIVALSGGADSTCLAFDLKEAFPDRVFNYLCTPTGDEPMAMFAHWKSRGTALGRMIVPVVATWTGRDGTTESGLDKLIYHEGTIPNRRIRYCTRRLKIEPYRGFLADLTKRGPVVSHVGLRADEEGRAGGAYADIDGVKMRFFLREQGRNRRAVEDANRRRGITIPERTDCRKCYHQQIGEWFALYTTDREAFDVAASMERDTGRTFREPKLNGGGEPVMVTRYGHTFAASSRDTWPARLDDMAAIFAAGIVPPSARVQRDLFGVGACRVCSL